MNKTVLLCAAIFVALLAGCQQKAANTNTPANRNTAATTSSSTNSTYRLEGAGIQFDIPKGWERKDVDNGVVIAPTDGGVSVAFSVSPDQEVDFPAIAKHFEDRIKGGGGDIEPQEDPQEDTHNGMPHTNQEFKGHVNGQPAEWSVDLLKADKPVVVMTTVAVNQATDAHKEAYTGLIQSIKKTR